jgi:hypothetical protein
MITTKPSFWRRLLLSLAVAAGALAAPGAALAAGNQPDCHAEMMACRAAIGRCEAPIVPQACHDCGQQERACEAARRAARVAEPAVQAARVCPEGWTLDAQFTSRRNPEAFKCLGTPGTQPATDYKCPLRLHLHRRPKEGSFICGGVL